MSGHSSLKTSNSLHVSSMKSNSSSTLTSMKLKTLLQTFILSHMYRIAHALTKAKSLLIQLLRDLKFFQFLEFPLLKKSKKKLLFGSFRLHYNWCNASSHVMPVYYDSSCNSEIRPTSFEEIKEPNELSRYLQWLEEKGNDEEISCNEIDRLADLFIAKCHENFRLEKVESYRRYQEMMARSI